jgi:REP element-mobilizing transposase RayT
MAAVGDARGRGADCGGRAPCGRPVSRPRAFVGVLTEHVHFVVSFAPDTTLSSFIREVKSRSALEINRGRPRGNKFRWCRGYYAGTLSWSHVAAARTYVGTQFQRHPHLVPV